MSIYTKTKSSGDLANPRKGKQEPRCGYRQIENFKNFALGRETLPGASRM